MTIDEEKLLEKITIPEKICGLQALSKTKTPDFWTGIVWRYRGDMFGGRTRFYQVDGVTFFYGTAEDLANLQLSSEEAQERFEQVMEYFHSSQFSWHRPGPVCMWVVASDGTPFVKKVKRSYSSKRSYSQQEIITLFHTAVPLEKRRKKEIEAWATVSMLNVDGNPNHKPEWNDLHHFILTVERLTIEKWKEKRRAFVKEAKASGAMQKRKDERKARRMMERTKRKMKAVSKVRTVIQELEQYIKDIEDGTATQSQVGDVYRSISELMSINKRVKTLFPKE